MPGTSFATLGKPNASGAAPTWLARFRGIGAHTPSRELLLLATSAHFFLSIVSTDKAAARRHFLLARRHVPEASQRDAAQAVSRTLAGAWAHIPWLLAYQSLGHELCLSVAIAEAQAQGIEVTTPHQHDDPRDVAQALAVGSKPTKSPLALLPGVAYDLHGTRLGRGAGFYDRLLALLPSSVVRIGVAYSCQITAVLPRDAHDVPVDALLTEQGLRLCASCRPQAAAWLAARGHVSTH